MKILLYAASLLSLMQANVHAQTALPHSRREAIHAIIDSQAEAWNRNDAAAWAKDFLDDASFINVRGDMVKGRTAVEKIHAYIFSGPYKGSHQAVTINEITYPSPDVAVVESTLEVTNFKGLPPGVVTTAPGVLRTRLRFILVQRDGGWKIFAAQNTAIAPQQMPVH